VARREPPANPVYAGSTNQNSGKAAVARSRWLRYDRHKNPEMPKLEPESEMQQLEHRYPPVSDAAFTVVHQGL
jgi:hypothetical protein